MIYTYTDFEHALILAGHDINTAEGYVLKCWFCKRCNHYYSYDFHSKKVLVFSNNNINGSHFDNVISCDEAVIKDIIE
jgi:hypothetical protein